MHAECHLVDTPSITGKVIGVKDITNIRACTSCGKITTPYQSSRTLDQCQGCSLIQILASCDIQWSLLLLIKASDDSKWVISIYNQQLLQPPNVLEIELKLNLVSVEQLRVALLQNTTILCIFHIMPAITRCWTCKLHKLWMFVIHEYFGYRFSYHLHAWGF